jgi:CubicO group peptidase (beta-lactamase class C family)
MHRLLAIAWASVSLATAALAETPQLDRADLEAWLDGFVPYGLQQGDVAGMVVSVVKDGQVLLHKGYGYADVVKKIPMDSQRTVLRVASVSKPFTATAAMQLVEHGKLDLNRDVNDYLDFKIPPAFGKPITLRHLLTHTAGFEETAYKRYDPPLSLREHLLMIPERIYPPGEVPAYSNYGLNLAGYIVARVSGENIAAYVERHIFVPLGMTLSTLQVTLPKTLQPFEAKNYPLASSREPHPSRLIIEESPIESPATGLATTAYDMTRFMLAHLQQGRYGDYQLLRPETLQLMHAPAFVPMAGAQPVALGLFRIDRRGQRVIGHTGDAEGLHAGMLLLPDENVGFFAAANSDGLTQSLVPAAFAMRNALFEQFVDRFFPMPAAPEEPTMATAWEHAQLAAGEYAWSRRQLGDFQEAFMLIVRCLALKIDVRANPDGTIEVPAIASFESGPPKRWREVAPFVWREVAGDDRLVMKVEDGRVQSFWIDSVASFMVNMKVPHSSSAGLHVPLLALAASILMLTTLLWPVAAIVRRRYGQTLQLAGGEWRAYQLTRFAAAIGAIYLVGWTIALLADFASTAGVEPWIRLIQLIGLICMCGAGVATWNAWLTLRGDRSVWAKAWSFILALALLYLVWFSFAFHLISVRLS